MRTWHVALLALALGLTGCRKKHAPEYFEAEGKYQVLVARTGDDAYLSPEMAAVLKKLQSVPEGRIESEQAQQLAARITAGTARVQAAQRAADAPIAAAPVVMNFPSAPSVPSGGPPADAVAPTGAADAGPVDERPQAGMPQAEFVKKFGSCFEGEREVAVPGSAAPLKGFQVANREACTKKFGATNQSYVFEDGKWKGIVTETVVTTVRDAGLVPTPPGQAPARPAPTEAPRDPNDGTPGSGGANPYDGTPRPGTP